MVRLLGGVLAVLFLPWPAAAFAWRARPASASVSYYYPAIVYYLPACAVVYPAALVAAPTPPARIYATPSPAPPSPQPIRPMPVPAAPAPGVRETQSLYLDPGNPAVAELRPAVSDRRSVAFWNSTGRPIALKVHGQVHWIAAGRGLTLELPRRFLWQIDDRESQQTELTGPETVLDIVIRR
jgi:hypothetical protein